MILQEYIKVEGQIEELNIKEINRSKGVNRRIKYRRNVFLMQVGEMYYRINIISIRHLAAAVGKIHRCW